MNLGTYRIQGNDFDQAGSASGALKEQLRKIGADPDIIRRAMIAAYEAEMNVVIHAYNGQLKATLNSHQLDVEVIDEGPGIPDVDLAMKEGFSTAPSKARELGFGAGMGLPNIKKNSDRFSIQSTVGQGTQLAFTVFLRPHGMVEPNRTSVHVVEGKCRECFSCLKTCPTKALRIRKGHPEILQYLCIDCAACTQVCKTGALSMIPSAVLPRFTEDSILVIPAAFLVQFGAEITPQRVLAALDRMGFQEIRIVEMWDHALRSAVIRYGREESNRLPVISPVCPAVVNLVEMRFPTLINNLAPFTSPIETLQEEFVNRHVIFVTSCPGQYTSLMARGLTKSMNIISPSTLRTAVQPLIVGGHHIADDILKLPGPNPKDERQVLKVTGIEHVLNIFEKMENGLLTDIPVLELYACPQGCFGGPLLKEDPFLAQDRWRRACGRSRAWGKVIRRKEPYAPRTGVRLDKDMTKAIEKLAKIDRMTRSLPGKDCGLCGSPTCGTLAEDIVLGRATRSTCVHINMQEEP